MKKSTKFIIALLVTVGALAITYRVVNQAPSKDLAADAQMQEIITSGGCLQCHSGSPDLPFYANWPVASGMVQKDVTQGYRAFDMTEMAEALKAGKPVGKVALAKVEKVIMDGTMPKHAYYMVHWGSSVTDAKKEMAMAWVKQHRLAHMLTDWLPPSLPMNRYVPSQILFLWICVKSSWEICSIMTLAFRPITPFHVLRVTD